MNNLRNYFSVYQATRHNFIMVTKTIYLVTYLKLIVFYRNFHCTISYCFTSISLHLRPAYLKSHVTLKKLKGNDKNHQIFLNPFFTNVSFYYSDYQYSWAITTE